MNTESETTMTLNLTLGPVPVTESTGEFHMPPEGQYRVKLIEIESDEPSEQFPDSGPRWKWFIELVDVLAVDPDEKEEAEEALGQELWQWTGRSVKNDRGRGKTIPLQWFEAFNGGEFTKRVDIEELKGKTARATIGRSSTGRAKITGMKPDVSKPAKQKAAPTEQPDAEDKF